MKRLLEVRDLKTHFFRPDGVVKAVDGISYELNQGDSLAIVGESGSGKSVGVTSLIQLVKKPGKVVGGSALFDGRDLIRLTPAQIQEVRGKEIGMIFQDPMSSLNPTVTIGKQIMEPILWHKLGTRSEARQRALELMEMVGIPAAKQRLDEYPFQFSGGMRQRVMIASAIACKPKLLIADEPTTALDVTVQAQILDLLRDMQKQLGMAVILITHDLGVAAEFCTQIAVMYAGRIVEKTSMDRFLSAPAHPYSQGLLRSTPEIGRHVRRLEQIPGSPPNLMNLAPGCPFAPRCPHAKPVCTQVRPELTEIETGHTVACHMVAEQQGVANVV
jgi:peptide/nickel transport system ATP-binding protein